MRISALKLQNYRCFAERCFAFADGFNLLIGDNASGKTALLEGLGAGLGAFVQGITRVAYPPARGHVRYQTFWKGQTLTLEPQTPTVVTCEGIIADEPATWWRETKGPEDRNGIRGGALEKLARTMREGVSEGKESVLPVLASFPTARVWSAEYKPTSTIGPGSRLDGYKECLQIRARSSQFVEWFKTRELESLQRNETIGVFEAVRAAILTCIADATAVRFEVGLDEIVLRFGQDATPFSSLSDGYRNMLAMVADIAHRAAVLNPQLCEQAAKETPGVVLIDELDLHLHPKWQRRVVTDLMRAFPKVQFIATTHSPFIIQSLPDRASVQLLNLDDSSQQDFTDKSIEDIAETVQGVEDVQRSARYHDMMDTAKKYYRLLREGKTNDNGKREELKRRLDELAMPFGDDPAFQAFLQMERVAAGLGGQHEAG
jgi:predicted ATP-binding protein involved in virulence